MAPSLNVVGFKLPLAGSDWYPVQDWLLSVKLAAVIPASHRVSDPSAFSVGMKEGGGASVFPKATPEAEPVLTALIAETR